jgi:hypothetical protein
MGTILASLNNEQTTVSEVKRKVRFQGSDLRSGEVSFVVSSSAGLIILCLC